MAKIFFKNSAKQYDTWNGLTFSFSENDNGRLEFKIDNPNQQIILEMDKSEFESEVRQVTKAIQVQAPVKPANGDIIKIIDDMMACKIPEEYFSSFISGYHKALLDIKSRLSV